MDNVCIPIHLDAFALSAGCCDGDSVLGPYTQPNYTSLQLDTNLIQNDVLDHVDFHLSSPSSGNPRIVDLGIPPGSSFPWKNLKRSRLGVHLSWSLPRLYRSAQASGKTPKPGTKPEDAPNPNPKFRPFPNRWLITRRLWNFKDQGVLPEWQSWVVESDTVRNLKTVGDGVDLESDVSPFVMYSGNPADPNLLRAQTEVFLGEKFDLGGDHPWAEDKNRQKIPNLTLMNSGNPMFADNALHNGNVLSMIDNFSFPDPKLKGALNYLEHAICDYFVIGWNSDKDDDPLNQDTKTDFTTRLSQLMLKFDDKYTNVPDVASNEKATRSLVHGAIYGVEYDFNYNPKTSKTRSLANEAAHKFTSDVKMEPLSVGTTPLDGILTFLQAHQADAESIFGPGANDLANSLMNIAQLLYATGDNYDSRVQAQDIIAQQNFARDDGGNQWIFSKTTSPGQPIILPTQADKDRLATLNEAQARLDATSRKLLSLRWELFAEWWKFVTKYVFLKDEDAVEAPIATAVTQLKNAISSLELLRDALTTTITNDQDPTMSKITTQDPYNTRIDPTLCIAGLDSGWPSDWGDTLQIRLARDLTKDDTIAETIFAGSSKNPVTTDSNLDQLARRILQECVNNSKTDNGVKGAPKTTGFLAWANKNPFVPICIEWEGLYYHVGPLKDKWEMKLRQSPVGHAQYQVRYVPKDVLSSDEKNHQDFRSVKGRVLVLPQPVFNLETLVKSVLDTASNQVPLTDAQKTQLRDNIRQIQFISAPISGLTNHLLTRYEGAHVKPSVRQQGDRAPTALTTAVRTAINIDEKAIQQIDAESALTPYGDSFPFGTDQYPEPPFKPVTHGQMILTKVNIIDKFGQAVSMPKTLRRPRLPPDRPTSNIYPCLSDWLSPDAIDNPDKTVKGKIMNTVLPTPDPVTPGQWPLCQYIQLTPSINQGARINASFLVRDTDTSTKTFKRWREASDYDPIVWGWVIINYADNGFQFFLGDGTFYREIRKGGVEGTNVGAKWLPYDPPTQQQEPSDANRAQLDQLISQLEDESYFQKFSDSINGSIQNMPFPPSDYSAYANSIIGKPLALVNVGWSLELAQPAIKSQNTLGKPFPDAETSLCSQDFPVKLGDIQRNYDGLVGYFDTDNDDSQNKTHWDRMYSYFVVNWQNLPAGQVLQLPATSTDPYPTYTVLTGDTLEFISAKLSISVSKIKSSNPSIKDASTNDTFQTISADNYPILNPYYIHPDAVSTRTFTSTKATKYKVTSMLIDPYTSIHAYSPILPTKTLTLPSYAIQTAFAKMHAFFHLGPMLLTTDVPATKTLALANPNIKLPVSGRKGTWSWFQPYDRDLDETSQEAKDDVWPRYAQMDVQEDLGDKKYEKGPFTFVEGFLQLMGSLSQKQQAQGGVNGAGSTGTAK